MKNTELANASSIEPMRSWLWRDATAGIVVALVALPLCFGIALASNAPLLSGVVAGIVGGIVVGFLSGSQTSISGPAAGLTAVVTAQIATLGSFQTFLLAVVFAGAVQIALGLARAGFVAAFIPSSVVKGLMAAIGLILVLKEIPHVVGHDRDPHGDLAFIQPDASNTFSMLIRSLSDFHPSAAIIGIASIALVILWERWKPLKESRVPSALGVVVLGVAMNLLFARLGGRWIVEASHLVQVPEVHSLSGLSQHLQTPDFSQWSRPAVYLAGLMIAAVASLESLVNLEAVDKLDPQRRVSAPSRELLSQGIGNVLSGLAGGLPVTSVIVRSSLNINAGAKTKLASMINGTLLLITVAFLPAWLNLIPLSCLAAILLVTGLKLASPALFAEMWRSGRNQFVPFVLTVASVVLTDPLIGVLIGMGATLAYIIDSNVRRPLRRIVEKHLGGDVLRIELPDQVSFLNRTALDTALREAPRGGHVLLDASDTDYIDPDLLSFIRDFQEHTAPARGVELSLLGFRDEYALSDQTRYVDYSTRELQSAITPRQVLQILMEGQVRARTSQRLTRDFSRQVNATAAGQHPLAVVLSCIDSRSPAELIFDLGMGDIFSVRIAGNVLSRKVLGSIEYGCAVAGAKLILVLGHTRCGAVGSAVTLLGVPEPPAKATGCQHIEPLIEFIQQSIDPPDPAAIAKLDAPAKDAFINTVARRNVARVVESLRQRSQTLDRLAQEGRIGIVGAMYDVASGEIDLLPHAELP